MILRKEFVMTRVTESPNGSGPYGPVSSHLESRKRLVAAGYN